MSDLNLIIANVNKLSLKEKKHIFDILIDTKCYYSHNKNGFFFDLCNLDEKTIKKILDCIELIHRHRTLIAEMDTRREEEILHYKQLITQKLENKKKEQQAILYDKLLIKHLKTNISFIIEKKITRFQESNFKPFKITPKHPWYTLHQRIKMLNRNRYKDKNTTTITIKASKEVKKDDDLYDIYIEDEDIEIEEDENVEEDEDVEDAEDEDVENVEGNNEEVGEDEEYKEDINKDLCDILLKDTSLLTENDYNILKDCIDHENVKKKINDYNHFKAEKLIFVNIKDKINEYRYILIKQGFVFNIVLIQEETI